MDGEGEPKEINGCWRMSAVRSHKWQQENMKKQFEKQKFKRHSHVGTNNPILNSEGNTVWI